MKYLVVLAVMATGLLCACSKQIGWEGKKPQTAEEQIAFDACRCVYSSIRAEESFDGETLIQEYEKVRKLGDEKLKELFPTQEDLQTAFPNLFKLSIVGGMDSGTFRNSTCMKSVDKRIEVGGFSYEEIKDLIAKRCPIVEIVD